MWQPGSLRERENKMAEDFLHPKPPPLVRGAHDQYESEVLKGEHGFVNLITLAVERGRLDLAVPAVGFRLLILAVVFGALALLGKLFGGRRS